jgi:hypothetical protein
MKSIVITPKDQSELKFISELLKKLGVSTRIMSDELKEDIGLSILMNEVDKNDFVSEEEIMDKLNS